jgi:hypothetical protein
MEDNMHAKKHHGKASANKHHGKASASASKHTVILRAKGPKDPTVHRGVLRFAQDDRGGRRRGLVVLAIAIAIAAISALTLWRWERSPQTPEPDADAASLAAGGNP